MSRAALSKTPAGPSGKPSSAGSRDGGAPAGTSAVDNVLALQRQAGNAAVGRLLARQPVDTDQVKASRRSIVIWEREVGKRIKLKSKLSVRGQVPKGKSDTLDAVVGATEADNVRKKASAIETEFVAYDKNIFQLTPDGVQEWAREHGVKATFEVEPLEASVKAAGDSSLPSIDLMKVKVKVEWFVGGAVLELEGSASLSPTVLLGAADRKLLEQFEKKAKEVQKELLELDKDKKALDQAKQRTEDARKAVDRAVDARRDAETARRGVFNEIKSTRQELQKATWNRNNATAAVERARQRQAQALRNIEHLKAKDWVAYRKQAQEIMDKGQKEIGDLAKKAIDAERIEKSLQHTLESHTRDLGRLGAEPLEKGLKTAQGQLENAKKAERKVGQMIERRVAHVKKLAGEASELASKGKSWVFKKIVGPRMLKLVGLVTKFIPFVNLISWAADIYEIGKLLFNLDKLKFGIGGGDGGAGGSGTGGTPSKTGQGSGTGAGKSTPSQAPGSGGGAGGTDPWEHTLPAPAPAGGKPSVQGPKTPTPQGKDTTGQGTTGTGKDPTAKTPGAPGKPPAPAGSQPGQGTDPAGTHDGPDKPGTKGTPGSTGTGTVGGGKPGQSGGTDPKLKPGDKGKQAGASGGKQGTGGKGDNAPGVIDKPKIKPKPKRVKWVNAVEIGAPDQTDVDVFKLGQTPSIEKIAGIGLWTSKPGTAGNVTLNVEYQDNGSEAVYRVAGIPVKVVARPVLDLPKNEPGLQSYNVEIVMEVTKNIRLGKTKLVINAGDELHYSWEGDY